MIYNYKEILTNYTNGSKRILDKDEISALDVVITAA